MATNPLDNLKRIKEKIANTPALTSTAAKKLMEPSTYKGSSTRSITTSNTINQGATFGAINYNPVSGSVGILGLGGGGAGAGGLTINQTSAPTTNLTTQSSYTHAPTTTNTENITNQISEYISYILNSPSASSGGGGQTSTPSVTVMPYITTPQTATQTATPTLTTEQTAGGGQAMGLVEILIIGGVAIVGIYLISNIFKKQKKRKK
jgi:hypothetical protein